MRLKGPAASYEHKSHIIKNVNTEFHEKLTRGQFIADWVAKKVGSWPFIIYQSVVIFIWISINMYLAYKIATDSAFLQAWDPYPFILLNLVLSFQAAYTGPVVMMSQNRQAEKDRLAADLDFKINKKAEEEIQVIMEHLVHQDNIMLEILERLQKLEKKETEK